jgi:predicted DsbA family dithiol-disulfide isomerase
MPDRIQISYFSDTLCVWAYVAQARLDELEAQFGAEVEIDHHFIPIFGSTAHRIGVGWQDRGGFAGYRDHVGEICSDYSHVELNPDAWSTVVPRSSAPSHHLLKAVQLVEAEGEIAALPAQGAQGRRPLSEELAWRIRRAFFRDGRDISEMESLMALAGELDLPLDRIERKMKSGEAMAAFCRDIELRDEFGVEGSPTYVLNQGRQKLYGNLGYRIIEANVQEVLRRPQHQASWC